MWTTRMHVVPASEVEDKFEGTGMTVITGF
jgi:hypothetical protein